MFFLDIILIFNTWFYNEDDEVITSRKQIAKAYLKGWFTIDVLAILPFTLFFSGNQSSTDYNSLVRVARIGRLYKLMNLTKLFRILKMVSNYSRLKSHLNDFMKVGFGYERLFFFFIFLMLICHLSACMWIISAQFVSDTWTGTWVEDFTDRDGEIDAGLYTVAFYWTVTTITTVGYGDINGTNNSERIVCCLVMLIGVTSFSYANGALASVLTATDN